MKITRIWAMPDKNTFSVKPIGEFVLKYLEGSNVSVDPFARNCDFATHTNDINPNTTAQNHIEAVDFIGHLHTCGVKADVIIFDPPYSPDQISRSYKEAGLKTDKMTTQGCQIYSRVKDAIIPILNDNATVLSFGWNSAGMGKKRGFEIIEIMLVNHGGAHYDTICMAERLMQGKLW